MNTKNYVYIFWIGLICFVISAVRPCLVQAYPAVINEIEQTVAPAQETPAQPDLEVPAPTSVEQSPVSQEEVQQEDSANKTDVDTQEQTTSAEEPTEEEGQEDITANVPQTNYKPVKKAEEVAPVQEKKSNPYLVSLSELFNRISDFFSGLRFDKIVELKNTIFQCFTSNKLVCKLSHKQVREDKPNTITKEFAPYYFLNSESDKNYLENIFFSDKIVNPKESLPYSCSIKKLEVKIESPKNLVTPLGTTDVLVLLNAPSPKIEVTGKSMFAKIVIDIRNNTLYKYDKDGFPMKAYLVATGARGTRTMPGLRVVTYKEKFPYAGAPESKRALDPYSYGPYILFLNIVDPKTGRQYVSEQLLHGNGNEYSIGRKVSHGCVRTNNTVMRRELSKEVKRGDYILLINPDV